MENSRLQSFKEFFSERFSAAAADVFGEVERIVGEYSEENIKLKKLLNTLLNPEIKLYRTDQALGASSSSVLQQSSKPDGSLDPEKPWPWLSSAVEKEEDMTIPVPEEVYTVQIKCEEDAPFPISVDYQEKENEGLTSDNFAETSDPVSQPTAPKDSSQTRCLESGNLILRNKNMEYILGRRRRHYRERIYRQRVSYINLSEEECKQKLHVSRHVVDRICRLVAPDLEKSTPGPCALPVAVKVTAALAFFATGSFQHSLGVVAGVGQTAISSAVHAVSSSLAQHANEFITFPTPDSQQRTKQDFNMKCGFPGILGAIDCTHVQLRAPSESGINYVNKKGVHSINIQVVCDAHCRVTHVFANYPGSTPDSFILANSVIPTAFQGDASLDGWLLGDNGYPLKPWLITPYIVPTTPTQHAFNSLCSTARSVIERTFGMLKMRFRCLDRSGGTLQYSPQKVSAFFVACCVLHNIALHHGCHIDLTEDAIQDVRRTQAELHVAFEGGEAQGAQEIRDRLAAELVP